MTPIEATPWVEQLASLKRFPRGEKAQQGLIQQFARHASDAAHAERMVMSILDENTEWPGPAVIRQAAARESDIVRRDNAAAVSQMEQWRIEFERDVKPWLCPDCNGWGVIGVEGPDGRIIRYDQCACPEGDECWIDPHTGRRCREGTPGAVLINTPQQLRGLNASLAQGKPAIPTMVRRPAAPEHDL